MRLDRNAPPRRGKVLVLVALSLTALLGMVGIVIDCGMLEMARRRVQNAADAGALAAAMEIFRGNTLANAATTATTYIQTYNGLTNAAVTIKVQTPTSGNYVGNTNYVEVVITAPQAVFLMPLLGAASTQTISARAVAGFEAISQGEGAIVLNPSVAPGLSISGGGTLLVKGAVVVNSAGGGVDQYGNQVSSTLNQSAASASNNSTVQAMYVLVHGGVNNLANFTNIDPNGPNPVFAGGPIASNPLRTLPVPVLSNGANPTVAPNPRPTFGSTAVTLSPGVYYDISLSNGNNVTFNPGIYIISPVNKNDKGISITGGTVNATGVMFYLTGSDYLDQSGGKNAKTPGYYDLLDTPLDSAPTNANLPAGESSNVNFAQLSISGNSTVNMTGLNDSSSPFNGIVFYQRPRNTSSPSITGTSGPGFNIGGTIYAQWANFQLAGGGTYNAQYLVGSLSISGSANITINAGGKSFGRANQVFLVE
jgi:Flp pilus assembly protein TadG